MNELQEKTARQQSGKKEIEFEEKTTKKRYAHRRRDETHLLFNQSDIRMSAIVSKSFPQITMQIANSSGFHLTD